MGEAERKEDVIRNLPEFKRERAEATSAAEQLADKEQAEEEEKEKQKEYNVHTIDEAEFEHYQLLEDAEQSKARRRKLEATEAMTAFQSERKRLRESDGADAPNLQQSLQ